MKKFLSLLIALILVFSMFAVTTVAFAADEKDENTHSHDVSFRADNTSDGVDGFKELVYDKHLAPIEMSKKFMLDGTITVDEKEVVWYKDEAILHQIFKGIRYIELKDEDYKEGDDTYELTYLTDDEPEAESYHATQHVKLAKAPKKEGKTFAGWKIAFSGMSDEYVNYIFKAEYEFNMPATAVTVTPVWEPDEGDTTTTNPELFYNDVIYVLYTSSEPKEDMKDWDRCAVKDTFSVTSAGTWWFRFAVADGSHLAEKDHTFDWEADVLATTFDNVLAGIGSKTEEELTAINYTLKSISRDTTHPVVALSSTMESKQTSGLTVGTSYSISTSLDIEDASSTTVTYLVYKQVGTKVEGADSEGWLLIYDSSLSGNERVIVENQGISANGSITPVKDDISSKPVYKIVYSVVDAYGFFGVASLELPEGATEYVEHHPVMLLSVSKAASNGSTNKALEAWKIVLYVIAGLSAVGIVVLLCVKPKQPEALSSAGANNTSNDSSDDSAQE